jgi:hypothetical protein
MPKRSCWIPHTSLPSVSSAGLSVIKHFLPFATMPPAALSFFKPLFHLNKHFSPKTTGMGKLLLFLVFTNFVQQINAIHLSSSTSKNSKAFQPKLGNQRQLMETKTIPLPRALSISSPVSFHRATPRLLFVDQDDKDSWHSPHAQEIFSDIPASSSRHLSEELQSVGSVLTLAGIARSAGATNGMGTNSRFNGPREVSISLDGLFALVADWNNHLIRQIILSTVSVSTLAGVAGSAGATNGIGTNSQFNFPRGVSISPGC